MKHLRIIIITLNLLFGMHLSLHASAASNDKFVIVQNEAQLLDGDEVIIVSKVHSKTFSKYQKKQVITTCSVNISSDGFIATSSTDSMQVFRAKVTSSGVRFATADGKWLCTAKSSTLNLFYGDDNPTSTKTTIALSIADDNATMKFDMAVDKYIRYKANTDRFNTFAVNTNYDDVRVYRKNNNFRIINEMSLSSDAGNANRIIEEYGNMVRRITINRTFENDGGFYTICLPFVLTEEDMATAFRGAAFLRFSSIKPSGTNGMVFHFERVSKTKAGEPLLLMPNQNSDEPLSDIVVHNKIISAEKPGYRVVNWSSLPFRFMGTFDPVLLPANGSIRFVSKTGVKLTTPNKAGKMPGLRAYFTLPSPENSTDFVTPFDKKECRIVVDGGDIGDTNSIHSVAPVVSTTDAGSVVYNMLGQRVNAPHHGIYIVNGKKIFIK